MSDSHAESPQQQDAENDIAGVSICSVHGSCCSIRVELLLFFFKYNKTIERIALHTAKFSIPKMCAETVSHRIILPELCVFLEFYLLSFLVDILVDFNYLIAQPF